MSLVFHSAAMKKVVAAAQAAAAIPDVSVLLVGETGVGKEVIADIIHSTSSRAGGPFIRLNCAAIPKDLIETELFGVLDGTFTGAKARTGLIIAAHDGTLLLDELSDMPIEVQGRLLRVMQDKKVRHVGGIAEKLVNVRFISCLNRDPESLIADGKLRSDLYYRISTVPIVIPPLRDRADDIIPLAQVYARNLSRNLRKQWGSIANDALEAMLAHSWPGNVRELVNCIERAIVLHPQAKQLKAEHLDLPMRKTIPISAEVTAPIPVAPNLLQAAIQQATVIITQAVVQTVTAALSGLTTQPTVVPAVSSPAPALPVVRKPGRPTGSQNKEKRPNHGPIDGAMRAKMVEALRAANGKPTAAAQSLGWKYDIFYRRRKRFKIEDEWQTPEAIVVEVPTVSLKLPGGSHVSVEEKA